MKILGLIILVCLIIGGSTTAAAGLSPISSPAIIVRPNPIISGSGTTGTAPLNVIFDGSKSTAASGYIKTWTWNFGDGTTGNGPIVNHQYENQGTFTVTLLVQDGSGASSSASTQVSVLPNPNSMRLLIIAIIIVIILIVLILIFIIIWTREILMLKPEKKMIPCDGSSTDKIKVYFANPFGRIRTPKKDREIGLTATSGSIQNELIIPAGKDHAEAILTASTEGGVVIISAKSGSKIADIQIEFGEKVSAVDLEANPPQIPADGKSSAIINIKVKNEKGIYFTSLNERTITLSTTLGTIAPSVIIPQKTLVATVELKSSQMSGTAHVTATSGSVTGETTVTFTSLGKRFCMHCGTTMSMEAQKCPNCGNTPPSGIDTKSCPTCEAVLPETAKYCDKCGARQQG